MRTLLALLATLAFTLSVTAQTKTDPFEEQKEALRAAGASPEDIDLYEKIYRSGRPTLVCYCHHDAEIPTCGVDGKLYLNECAARCAHVEVACTGDHCGDCSKYAEAEISAASAPSVEMDDLEEFTQTDYGRRFLAV